MMWLSDAFGDLAWVALYVACAAVVLAVGSVPVWAVLHYVWKVV